MVDVTIAFVIGVTFGIMSVVVIAFINSVRESRKEDYINSLDEEDEE